MGPGNNDSAKVTIFWLILKNYPDDVSPALSELKEYTFLREKAYV
jgi:hypothetical protein